MAGRFGCAMGFLVSLAFSCLLAGSKHSAQPLVASGAQFFVVFGGFRKEILISWFRLRLFSHLDVKTQNSNRSACRIQISVEIGDRVWQHELASKFYAFQVPLDPFLGITGFVSIDISKEQFVMSLWRGGFVIDDTGGYQLDASIIMPASLDCSAETIDSVERERLSNAGKMVAVVSKPARVRLKFCVPWDDQICPNADFSVDADHDSEEKLLTVEADSSMQRHEDEDISCCMVFGYRSLQSWHLVWLTFIGALVHFLVFLLKSFLALHSSSLSSSLNYEHTAASWELCSSMKKGGSCKVLASGVGCFEKAWSDAEHLLSNCASDGACFYYNCGPLRKSSQSGKRNRDSFGRLTRSQH